VRAFWLVSRQGIGVVLLVWLGHRRALRAGGYGWRRYWRAAWSKMNAARRMMDPRRYAWDGGARLPRYSQIGQPHCP
jgi:hypothetical protein